jgi:hypothetical protein
MARLRGKIKSLCSKIKDEITDRQKPICYLFIFLSETGRAGHRRGDNSCIIPSSGTLLQAPDWIMVMYPSAEFVPGAILSIRIKGRQRQWQVWQR